MAEEKSLTLEEALALQGQPSGAASSDDGSYTPPYIEPKKSMTLEEAHGIKPASERKFLDRGLDETTASGFAKGAGTATISGLSELPITGMIGSLRELGNLGIDYAASKLSGKPFEEVREARQKLDEAMMKPAGTPLGRLEQKLDPTRLPSGHDISSKIFEHTGEYEPESGAGKTLLAFGSAGVSGLSPSGKIGPIKKALDIAEKAALVGSGGAAADLAARYTGSVPLALAAGALTPSALKSIPTIARAHLAAEPLAKDVAAKAVQEAARDKDKAAQALEQQGKLAQGIDLTSAQRAEDTGIAALEKKLQGRKFEGTGTQQQDVLDQIKANEEAMKKAAQEGARRIQQDMTVAYDLTGSAPRELASKQAREIFSSLEEKAHDAANKLWSNPALATSTMYKKNTIGAIDDYIANLSPTKRNAIPDVIKKTIDELRDSSGSQIKINYLQDLRSDTLAKARAAYAAGDDVVGATNYALADKMREILSNEKNYSFGGMRYGESTPQAWKDAVEATRLYHESFNSGFLKSLNKEIEGGVTKVPMDATFRAMMSDRKTATQNLSQLQAATDGKINPAFSDYMVAYLTNNGKKIVTPKQVDDFMGKEAALINMTPGLKERLTKIKSAGENNQLSAGILSNMDDPRGLAELFQNNRAAIARATQNSPQDRAYFRMLEQSARKMVPIEGDKAAALKTLDQLATGRTSDILYGVASGRIASALIGLGAAKATTLDPTLGTLLGVVGGGLAREGVGPFRNMVDGLLSGNVREKAIDILQAARSDPALMAELLKRPSSSQLQSLFTPNVVRAATTPVEGAIEDYYDRGNRFAGGRVGRATGGRTMQGGDIDAAADALVRAAETTKKSLGKETEVLLNHDDNTIASALEVANKAI